MALQVTRNDDGTVRIATAAGRMDVTREQLAGLITAAQTGKLDRRAEHRDETADQAPEEDS